MSINYYWRTVEDEANEAEGMHIGKWANGGMSCLRGHLGSEAERPILSWQDWKTFLREHDASGVVTAEHGLTETVEEFIASVEDAPRYLSSRHYLTYVVGPKRPDWRRQPRTGVGPDSDWMDREGFSFYSGEFC